MAKLETFFELEEINVTASVGSNGVNLEDDVMVVQALLKYALAERGFFRKMTFSEPTGTMDDNTKSLIKQFQRFVRKMNNADISVDGRIDARTFRKTRNRLARVGVGVKIICDLRFAICDWFEIRQIFLYKAEITINNYKL